MKMREHELSRRDMLKVAGAAAIATTLGNHEAFAATKSPATLFAAGDTVRDRGRYGKERHVSPRLDLRLA